MRKGHKPTVDLRHRTSATVPCNVTKIVNHKELVPKETMHYSDGKTSQLLGIFAAKGEDTFCLRKSEIKHILPM